MGPSAFTISSWPLLAALLSCCLLTGCDTSPTGRRQLTLLPQEQVESMGSHSFAALRQQAETESNPAVKTYVACVAQAIIDELRDGPSQWEIEVFRNSSANAFALPGGKIGINTGLLKVATDENQLAAVVGHEVGHVLANHSNERLSQEFAVDAILSLIYMFFNDQESITDDIAIKAMGVGAQFGVLLPFSRTHESEADIIGLELMARAGFDPRQSIALWQGMDRASERQPPEFLSTHPSHGTRIDELEEHMAPTMQLFESARERGKRPACAAAS